MPPLAAQQSSHAPRVLIVDDEELIRLALRRVFTRMGWNVEEAPDGARALAMLAVDAEGAGPYTLIVCDLRMPGISGIELHAQLATARPELLDRLVFSSGDLASDEAAAFVDATRCTVLQKPFDLSTLRDLATRIAAAQGVAAEKSPPSA